MPNQEPHKRWTVVLASLGAIARSAVLLGRTAADVVMNIMTLIVMVLVGLAVGFRPSEPVYELLLAFALVLAFSYVFSWAVNALRALTIGEGDALGPALGTLAWLAGLLLVFVPLAVRAFRRA